ncbi:MAG: hypothetical protein GX605_06895, partial [Chloroflexi bacterium]|nr:hypothetical protein [Chloroflexota bacterium]
MFHWRTRLPLGLLAAALLIATASPAAGEEPPPALPPWLAALRLPASEGLAAPGPAQLSVQGVLTDPASGQPLANGLHRLRLALYRQAAGGAPFWEETQEALLEGGVFSLRLGSVRGDLDPAFFHQPVYLGITVGGDAEMQPRQLLTAAPLALVAQTLQPGAQTRAEAADPLLGLENRGPGLGLYVSSAGGSGLVGQSALTDTVGLSGLSTYGAGVGGFASFGVGGYFASAEASGLVGSSIGGGTAGVEGRSQHGVGVLGQSASGFGIHGASETAAGGLFSSVAAPGLRAVTASPSSYDAAVQASNLGGGPGLWAESSESHGVQGSGALSAGAYGGYFVGHGGVHAQGTQGPALVADGPIVSTAPSHLWVGGLAFHLAEGEGVTVIPQPGGGITLTANAPTVVRLCASFAVPAVLYGQPLSVSGLRVSYRSTHAQSYIDHTTLGRADGAG